MVKERALITGGAGYLDSVITSHFLEQGYKLLLETYQDNKPAFLSLTRGR